MGAGFPRSKSGAQMHQELYQPGLQRWDSMVKMGSTSFSRDQPEDSQDQRAIQGYQPKTSRDIRRMGSFAYRQQQSGEEAGEWGGTGVLGLFGWTSHPIG